MVKCLFICENPYQTMVAMVIKYQMFHDSVADMIITDRSADSEKRYLSLKRLSLFRNVVYAATKKCHPDVKTKAYYQNQVECILTGCSLMSINGLPNDYDEIFTLDVVCITDAIVSNMQRIGKLPEINLVDEGFGCYTDHYRFHLFGFHKGRNFFQAVSNFLHRKKDTISLIRRLYLFQPEMCQWKPPFELKQIQMPDFLSFPELKDMINQVFDYNEQKSDYEKPFLFFEDCTYQDTGNNGDLDMIVNLADKIGRENLMVKLHPRSSKDRFKSYGITTNNKKGMPWEVIIMNMDNAENHIFITISSSAVITYRLLFDKSFKSMLLFKCFDRNNLNVDSSLLDFLEKFAIRYPNSLYIPDTLTDAYQKIDEWRQQEAF